MKKSYLVMFKGELLNDRNTLEEIKDIFITASDMQDARLDLLFSQGIICGEIEEGYIEKLKSFPEVEAIAPNETIEAI